MSHNEVFVNNDDEWQRFCELCIKNLSKLSKEIISRLRNNYLRNRNEPYTWNKESIEFLCFKNPKKDITKTYMKKA